MFCLLFPDSRTPKQEDENILAHMLISHSLKPNVTALIFNSKSRLMNMYVELYFIYILWDLLRHA